MSELDDAYNIAVKGAIEKAVQETAAQALTGVVTSTPVGNPDLWQGNAPPGYAGGHARRNWLVSIGRANEQEVPGEDASGQEAIADGIATARRFTLENTRIVLHNSAPYIKRLNDGWSSQAPAGFVEHNAERAARITARKYG